MADKQKVTLSTLNTRTGVKKQTSHSSYWLDEVVGDWDDDVKDPNTIDKAIRLSAVRRAVSNFVRILTNDPKISVKFNESGDSYTDGKTVVIAAQDNPKDFDVMVGLALHEASHCLLTDIHFYGALTCEHMMTTYDGEGFLDNVNRRVGLADFFHPDFRNTIVTGSTAEAMDLFSKVMLMLNVVEDRRIDAWVYNTAVGYRPYYGALYKKYFLSTAIDKALKGGVEWKEVELDSYINRIINIMNPNSDASALPHLDTIFKTFNVENIHRLSDYTPNKEMQKFIQQMTMHYNYTMSRYVRGWSGGKIAEPGDVVYIREVMTTASEREKVSFDHMPPTWILANELLAQTIKACNYQFNQTTPPPQTTLVLEEGDGEGDGKVVDVDADADADNKPSAPQSPDRLKKAVAAQRKFLEGKIRKTKIAKKLNDMVRQVEESSAEIVEVGGKTTALGGIKTPCIVINNVTKQTMFADWFIFGPSNYYGGDADRVVRQNDPYVKAGIRMGQILSQRLAIRNDPTITHYTRQDAGRIDRRILAQLGMDITNVFKKTRTDKFNPVTLYLSLDASGSMGGQKWGKALTVATALSYLADKVPDINVVVMARGGSDVPTVAVLHDSRKQKFAVARQILELTTACGSTPEALCFEATLNFIIDKEKKSDVYFINFSDGEPIFSIKNHSADKDGNYYSGYSGELAVNHCRQMMNLYREAGVRILSYFISERAIDINNPYGGAGTFRKMYGQDAEFVNVQNVTMVLKTLQKLLSDKGSMESTFG